MKKRLVACLKFVKLESKECLHALHSPHSCSTHLSKNLNTHRSHRMSTLVIFFNSSSQQERHSKFAMKK